MQHDKSYYEINNNRDTSLVYYIISFVCSVIAFFICWIPFVNFISIFFSLIGLAFGIAAYRRAKKALISTTMPLVAIIISLFPLVISIGTTSVLLIYINK
ncbi:hypothetical protein VSP10_00260 [Myroides odoratimimus]|uniref:hypothetical protein n=1 Tax=Myroides odoratimimus TaxID=76832 RepID=UPI002097C034|nr:hypothetical protein [Myroides odoratimimus]MCO7723009.1 hypothetical protein [Myroides odoratimimus]MEC4051218.1 hypothetical protein [Myroides odoratimimus]WHT73972.1 hypothetical protein QK342_02505 [Myroides odoratimimus]WHU38555.1 hypothetical protein QNM93_02505 [Myroides odoratimimus]